MIVHYVCQEKIPGLFDDIRYIIVVYILNVVIDHIGFYAMTTIEVVIKCLHHPLSNIFLCPYDVTII